MNTTDNVSTAEVHKIGALENMNDWQVHSDDIDIRGWDLYTYSGEKIGEVKNLIADTEAKKVRYVEVELEGNLNSLRDTSYRTRYNAKYHPYYGKEDDKHVLIPIGMLEIDRDNKKVLSTSNLSSSHFASSPRYSGVKSNRITPIYELLVVKHYADQDDNYRDVYNEKKYDLETYRTTPYVSDNSFYNSDFFSRDRYRSRYRNRDNNMTGFGAGSTRR